MTQLEFQSTLPARGATVCSDTRSHLQDTFQSTLPARGATWDYISEAYGAYISIHAPRTGSDLTFPDFRIRKNNFNPRSPHGERRGGAGRKSRHAKFQSTLPARGATEISALAPSDREISIHAPRTGSDWDDINKAYSVYISIHAPRTGSDLCVNVKG